MAWGTLVGIVYPVQQRLAHRNERSILPLKMPGEATSPLSPAASYPIGRLYLSSISDGTDTSCIYHDLAKQHSSCASTVADAWAVRRDDTMLALSHVLPSGVVFRSSSPSPDKVATHAQPGAQARAPGLIDRPLRHCPLGLYTGHNSLQIRLNNHTTDDHL